MTTFKNAALQPQVAFTENGMEALDKTGSELVDLFFNIGSARNNLDRVTGLFSKAFFVDKTLASRVLFWARDVRGGAGERETFRHILRYLEIADPFSLKQLIPFIPEYGRWDDLLIFKSSSAKKVAFEVVKAALLEENGLCAKWMPRKGEVAVELRNYLHLSPKQYRKTLVRLTNVVEQKMCAQKWEDINFEHVPSIAAKQYRNAFTRHCGQSYEQYANALENGTAKINASAIFPHDVLVGLDNGNISTQSVAVAQWDSLPNYLGDDKILPLIDTSGSMTIRAGKSSVSCLDIAVGLGLYLADKQKGDFSGMFINFSQKPRLNVLTGNIVSKRNQMVRSEWGFNTNIEAAFKLILQHAKRHNIAEKDMPKYLLIISDMQFDTACGGYSNSAMKMLEEMYDESEYTLPTIIFWNMNGAYENVPVKKNENGTILISGYSPAILKDVLKAPGDLNPMNMVLNVIDSDRYSRIVVE